MNGRTQVQKGPAQRNGTSPFRPVPVTILQRKCACDLRERAFSPLQRSATTAERVEEVPPIVHEVLRSSGQALDAQTRSFFEPRFNYDFSQVRVHADAKAAESAQSVNALAYTVGPHVVLGTGRYVPGTPGGKKLLAHELTHVMQQASASAGSVLKLGPTGDAAEREAHRIETTIGGQDLNHQWIGFQRQRAMATLQRQPAHDESVPRKHKVKKNETLSQIAAEFGVSVEELKKANSKNLKRWPAKNTRGTKIIPHFVWGFNAGDEITIPPTEESASATPPRKTGADASLGVPGEVKKAGGGEENVPPKTISFKPQPTKLSEEAIQRMLANNRQLRRAMLGLVLKPESKPKKETTEFSTGSELQREQGKTSAIIFFSLSIPIAHWKLKKPLFGGDLKAFDKLEVQVSGGLKPGDSNQPRWLYPIAGEAALNMIHYERPIIDDWLKLELRLAGKISGDYLEQTKEKSAAIGGALGGGIEFNPGKDSPWAFYLQGTGEVMWDAKTINWKDLSAKPVWGLNVGISRKF